MDITPTEGFSLVTGQVIGPVTTDMSLYTHTSNTFQPNLVIALDLAVPRG